MKIKIFEAFAGYGSQSLSLQRLKDNFTDFDYQIIGISEIDRYAIQAYNCLHPDTKNYGDISKIDWSDVPDFDLLTYSSPCQDFSAAGLQRGGQKGSGTRSSLLWECERAIEAKKPKYLLMENVAALVSSKFIKLFNKWQNTLESYGYTNYAQVLNAKDYGVPQNRERIFMVSIRNDINHKFYFPQPFKLEKRLKDILEDKVDEKYYLSDKLMNAFTNSSFERGGTSNVDILGSINNSQDGIVVNPNGISPTHTSGHGNTPKIIESLNEFKCNNKRLTKLVNEQHSKIEGAEPKFLDIYNQAVKDECVTIKTNVNTCNLYYVTESTIGAMRGRNPANPSDRSKGTHYEQRLEVGGNISNTLTSVQKDNIVVEPLNEYENGAARTIKSQYAKNGMANFKRKDGLAATGVMQIGNIADRNGFKNPQEGRIYSEDGLSPTIQTSHGGGFEPKIVQRPRGYNKGGEHDLYPTIGCNSFQENNMLNSGFRIRKLTPKECFRLMDVSDYDIDKLLNSGISNSQLYKLAGNSIVVSCLYHIFRKLFVETENDSKQLELF
jgi:DNA (cytosine-5)-methyltransferase 1